MTTQLKFFTLFSAIMVSLLSSNALQAGSHEHRHDHDRARVALEAGEILPLSTILKQLEQDYPGQVMEVELDHEETLWVYEIKLLRDSGALMKLKINASDGTLLGVKGRELAPETDAEGKD